MPRAVCIVLLLVSAAIGSANVGAQSSPGSGRGPKGTDPFSGLHAALDQSFDTTLAAATSPATSGEAEHPKVVELRSAAAVASGPENASVPANKPSRAIERLEQLRPLIEPILRTEGVPLQLAFLVVVESGGRPDALSPKGARGLWQLMPNTARHYGLIVDGEHDERLDVRKSTRAAAQYLRDLHLQFNSWPMALAAYNAGEPAVQKAIDRAGDGDFAVLSSRRLLPAETRNYVPAVLRLMGRSRGSDPFHDLGTGPSQVERIVYAMQTSEVLP